MLTIPEFSIESIIPIFLSLAWGSISAYQILAAKIRRKRCVICSRGVFHEEQAHHVSLPCHQTCIGLASLILEGAKKN